MSGDLISRQAVLDLIEHYNSDGLGSVFYGYEEGEKFANAVKKLSPINPQETSEWCTDCKEYDQNEHCCHRLSRVIRDTVEEMKQEPVLEKIRAEIVELTSSKNAGVLDCLDIIDKYRAESEDGVCKDCCYNDGEVHAECVICDKVESE